MTSLYPSATLVVVDSTVKDYQGLVDSVSPDTEVIVLNPAQNGLEQITAALAHHRNLRSLHILSHGETGSLRLGNGWVTAEVLERYAHQLQTWVKAIATDATILLYGCRVAADAVGQAFVQRFSQLTGVAIAASTTLTGSQALGGDWRLEFTTGADSAALAFASEAMAAYAHVLGSSRLLLTETFTGDDVVDPRWLFGVGDEDADPEQLNPFLTARDTVAPSEGPDPTVGGGLPGNPGTAPYPPVDADGEGALRLTNAINDQASYVLYNNPIPSSAGLVIEFDFFSYGGTGADGISFFLADGASPPQQAGAFGGSLGYADNNQPPSAGPGVAGGYVGIGFDEFGNFSNPTEGRSGGIGQTPDSIAIRGSADNDYAYLTGTTAGELAGSIDVPTATNREDARRRARVTLTPEGLLSVQVDFNGDDDYIDPGESPDSLQNFNLVAANGALPETFTFGFASGTGIFNNVHEIRTLDVSTFTAPPTVLDVTNNVPPATVVNVTGLSATDPDGTIETYTIVTVPTADQGTLFLGDPAAGGTAVTAGQVLTPDQITQLFFQPVAGFTGATFTYNATDDLGAEAAIPGTVTLALLAGDNTPPTAGNVTVVVPDGTTTAVSTLPVADADGTVSSVTIVTLPSDEQGQLFVGDPLTGGRAVTAGETLTLTDANQLFFRPEGGFTNGTFTYFATDDEGAVSSVATVTLSVTGDGTNQPPVASNSTAEFNVASVSPVPSPVAVDSDGSIASYTIVTLPPTEQGQLFVGDPTAGGRVLAVGDVLTPAEAGQLFFQATDDFSGGNFTFFATDNEGAVSNTATFTLESSAIVSPGDCVPGIREVGTGGADVLNGTPDQDTLIGGAGNDTLRGRDCDDTLRGGGGRDQIFGGAAGDTINGNQAADRLHGDDGNDTLRGGLGRDRITGNRADDRIVGGRGNDRLLGRGGDDVIIGGFGRDTINGGTNNDFLQGRQGRDVIRGKGGEDLIFGNLRRDRLFGGRGADTIYGGRGNDFIKGQSDADVLFGQIGNDRILGGSQGDQLLGGVGRDTLIGGGGADTLTGGGGRDLFRFRNITHGGDVVVDFETDREQLDFGRIFVSPEYTQTRTFAYIQRIQSGADTVIRVDSNGQGDFIDYVTLLNVDRTSLTASNFIV
jgi:Ca2+-binding RTX toxin-like protein